MMSYVNDESVGAAYRISTIRPKRRLDAEQAARQAAASYGQEGSRTVFPGMGEEAALEFVNRSAESANARPELEVTKWAPSAECVACGAPASASWHDRIRPRHAPQLRVPGVHEQVDLDERLHNPGYRPEPAAFQLEMDDSDPAYQEAQARFDRRHARFRPDPDHPANWRAE
jgi:hypothetical protein